MIHSLRGFNMTEAIAWKISLPASAPRQAAVPDSAVQKPGRSQERADSEKALSPWLSTADVARMKDRDVIVLAGETSSAAASASRSSNIWRLFPNVGDIPSAERMIADFKASVALERELGREARALCESLGLEWKSSATANTDTGEKIAARYASASEELGRLSQSLQAWTGCAPTIHDVTFVTAVAASLRLADIPALSGAVGRREEVDRARGMIEDLDKAAADLVAEFSFDPSEHSPAAFGGLSRAFASGRAQDFLAAARKLGITPKGPEQAQRAAALLKKYIAALLDVAPSGSDRHADIIARARLAQSVARRADVLGIDLQLLSPPIRQVDLLDFSAYPGDEVLTANPDTRKLIEDNGAATPAGTLIEGLSSELTRQAAAISRWVERHRRGIRLLAADGTHDQVEDMLQANPDTGFGPALATAQELEAAETHVQWLQEAMMLPLDDEQLAAFVGHLARLTD
jgi:broad specificity phosphatase PhoE